MNFLAAQEQIRESLDKLSKRLNIPLQQLGAKYISSDIIMNGALAVIRKRDWEIAIENDKGEDAQESYFANIRRIANFQSQVKQNPEYSGIVTNFKNATLIVVKGTAMDDALYIEEEIYKVLQNEYGLSEDVLRNYFKQYHGLNLFDNSEESDESDY